MAGSLTIGGNVMAQKIWKGADPQNAGTHGRCPMVAIGVSVLSPLAALIAGILILMMPRLLNYVVAIYLILVGVLGLMGR
jgi:hypothetical protein